MTIKIDDDLKEELLKQSNDSVYNWCMRNIPFFDVVDAYACYYLWQALLVAVLLGMILERVLWGNL